MALSKPPMKIIHKFQIAASSLLILATLPVHAQKVQTEFIRPFIILTADSTNKLTFDESSKQINLANDWKGSENVICATGKDFTNTKWRKYSFSFTPQTSGNIKISLQSQHSNDKPDPIQVDYDAITVEGGTLENGELENKDAEGKAKSWTYTNDVIPEGSETAKEGSSFVTATWKNTISNTIQATEGNEVTINFYARAHTE